VVGRESDHHHPPAWGSARWSAARARHPVASMPPRALDTRPLRTAAPRSSSALTSSTSAPLPGPGQAPQACRRAARMPHGGREREGLPDRPCPRTTTFSPAATRPRTTARTAIETGRSGRRAPDPDRRRETPGRREQQPPLESAVLVHAVRLMSTQALPDRPGTRSKGRRRRPATGRPEPPPRLGRAVSADLEDRRGCLAPLDARVERRRSSIVPMSPRIVEVRAAGPTASGPTSTCPGPGAPGRRPTTSIDPRPRDRCAHRRHG
jgi:hypothetical protein